MATVLKSIRNKTLFQSRTRYYITGYLVDSLPPKEVTQSPSTIPNDQDVDTRTSDSRDPTIPGARDNDNGDGDGDGEETITATPRRTGHLSAYHINLNATLTRPRTQHQDQDQDQDQGQGQDQKGPLQASQSQPTSSQSHTTQISPSLSAFFSERRWRILEIDRTRPGKIIVKEDPTAYSFHECEQRLQELSVGHATTGGLHRVCDISAVLGVMQLLTQAHLVVATTKQKVASIRGQPIYRAHKIRTFPVYYQERVHSDGATTATSVYSPEGLASSYAALSSASSALSLTTAPSTAATLYKNLVGASVKSEEEEKIDREIENEAKYVRLLDDMLSRSWRRDCYFSYTYDLSRTQQKQYETHVSPPSPAAASATSSSFNYRDMFVWNHFLAQPLIKQLQPTQQCYWIQPLMFGFVEQTIVDLHVRITLIARRSRFRAGTRYLRRGIDEDGNVANEVESEQIVELLFKDQEKDQDRSRGGCREHKCVASTKAEAGTTSTFASSLNGVQEIMGSSDIGGDISTCDEDNALDAAVADDAADDGDNRLRSETAISVIDVASTSSPPPSSVPSTPGEKKKRELLASVTVYRGSIPLYWSQPGGFGLKPDILPHPERDIALTSTKKHFQRLGGDYSFPIICMNLIKQREKAQREGKLGVLFGPAVRAVENKFKQQHDGTDAFGDGMKGGPNGGGYSAGNAIVTPDTLRMITIPTAVPLAQQETQQKEHGDDESKRERKRSGKEAGEDVMRNNPHLVYKAYDMLGRKAEGYDVLHEISEFSEPMVCTTGWFAACSGVRMLEKHTSPMVSSDSVSSSLASLREKKNTDMKTVGDQNDADADADADISTDISYSGDSGSHNPPPSARMERTRSTSRIYDLDGHLRDLATSMGNDIVNHVDFDDDDQHENASNIIFSDPDNNNDNVVDDLDDAEEEDPFKDPFADACDGEYLSPQESASPAPAPAPAPTPAPASSTSTSSREREHALGLRAIQYQRGLVRINCIDCLDRTNVAMFCVGRLALANQWKHTFAFRPSKDNSSKLKRVLEALSVMYSHHGDRIASQYAGSGAMHREVLTEHVETLKGMDRDDGTNEYRTATDSVDGNVNDSVDDKDKRMSENEERGITGLLRSTTTEATETKHSSNTTIADKKDIEGTHRRNESVDLLQQTSTDDSDANDNASAGVNTTISALGDGDSGKKATADDDQDVGGDEIDDEGFGVSTLNYLDDLFKRTGITDSIEKTVLKTQGVAHNVSSFVKRYVRNNFYDSDKQNGLNLYLGYYQPSLDEKKALWEFDPLKSLPAPVTAPFPFASVSSSTSSLVSKASFTFSDTSPYLYSYYSASSSSFNHHNTAFHSMQTDGQMPASLDHTTEKASSHNYYYYQDLYLRKRQSCIGTGDSSTVHGPMKARSASDTMYDDSPVSSSASLPSPMLSLSAEGAPSPAAFRARGRTPSSLQREFTKFMTAEERKAVNISLVALLQRKRPRVLFITQRSKNENIVVYECNGLVKRNGRVDFSDEPMEAYWLKIDPAYVARSRKKGITNDRRALSLMEQQFYFGFKTRVLSHFEREALLSDRTESSKQRDNDLHSYDHASTASFMPSGAAVPPTSELHAYLRNNTIVSCLSVDIFMLRPRQVYVTLDARGRTKAWMKVSNTLLPIVKLYAHWKERTLLTPKVEFIDIYAESVTPATDSSSPSSSSSSLSSKTNRKGKLIMERFKPASIEDGLFSDNIEIEHSSHTIPVAYAAKPSAANRIKTKPPRPTRKVATPASTLSSSSFSSVSSSLWPAKE